MEYNVYAPVGACREVFVDRHPCVILGGPAGTGKSRACLELVHAIMLKYPGARAMFVRQTLASMRTTLLVTYEDEVLSDGDPVKSGANRESRMVYTYPNGSEIVLFGLLDVNRSLSGQFDIIYIQQLEECNFGDVQKLTTRLRNGVVPYQRLIGDCNPQAPTHWIKEQEQEGWLKLIETQHEDNPRFFNKKTGEWTPEGVSYIRILDALQGHEKDRLRYGRWVSAEGARWAINPSEHVFRMNEKWPYGVPAGQRILIGMDWGSHAPFAALWIAIDTEKNAWVFREAYQAGLTADGQAEKIVELTGHNEQVHAIYPDPTVFNTNSGGNKTIADYYRDVFARDKRFGPVLEGDRTHNRRKQGMATIDAMIGRNNGFPNLYIEQGCENLIKELGEARWWQPKHGIAKEDIDPKCADHAITALYYALNQWYDAPEMVKAQPTYEESREAQHKEIYVKELRSFGRTHGGRPRVRV